MNTLIINGSPRGAGDTAALVAALRARLRGAVQELHVYTADISPCADCRHCRNHPACAIEDNMVRLYAEIAAADSIVLASPVFFSALSGPLLSVLSRLQLFYMAQRYQGIVLSGKPKRGAILLAAGGASGVDAAEHCARLLLRQMGATALLGVAMARNTDELPASADTDALHNAAELGAALCSNRGWLVYHIIGVCSFCIC